MTELKPCPFCGRKMRLMTRGESMRAARRAAGLTLRELAARSGVSHQTIWKLEHDVNVGTVTTVELLADVLGLSIDAYVGHKVKEEA